MRRPHNNWPQSDAAQSILMFAQSMREMLWHQSWDNYKVPTLNSYYRLLESIMISTEIKANLQNPKVLEPVLAEILWSTNSDLVLRRVFEGEIEVLLQRISESAAARENWDDTAKYIINKCNKRYFVLLKSLIIECIKSKKEKQKIYDLSKILATHLINIGYSRLYILSVLDDIFFSINHTRIDYRKVSKFFSIFDERERSYTVILRISSSAAGIFDDVLGGLVYKKTSDVPVDIYNLAKSFFDFKGEACVSIKVDALDMRGARERGIQFLEYLFSISRLRHHRLSHRIGREALVYYNRSKVFEISPKDISPMFRRKPSGSSLVSRDLNSNVDRVEKLPIQDRIRFVRAMRLRISAHEARSHDIQLISIWSAIETLLTEPKDQPRIIHYTNLITPMVCRKYCERVLDAFWADVVGVDKNKAISVLSSINDGDRECDKVFHLLTNPKYDAERSILLANLHNCPLGRWRAWRIAKDMSSPKDMLNYVKSHEQRVSWQIHRVYRARNMVVHSGRLLPYMETLVMNIDEYFINMIKCLFDYIDNNSIGENLSDVIFAARIDHLNVISKLERLAGSKICHVDQLAALI